MFFKQTRCERRNSVTVLKVESLLNIVKDCYYETYENIIG